MSTVLLHAKLYRARAVREAIKAYADFARFKIARDGAYIAVQIEDPDPDFKAVLGDEIANYALALTIDQARPG